MRETFARFDNLPVDAFGLSAERIAAALGFFVNFELELIEAVLPDTLDSKLYCAQLLLERDEAAGEVLRVVRRVCCRAEKLQFFIAEERVQAFYVAFAIGAARFGHHRMTTTSLLFVGSMVWMKHLGDGPEQFA